MRSRQLPEVSTTTTPFYNPHSLFSPLHMFDKFSTRPSTIEMRLSFDSFIYAQVRSAKHDRANLCHHRSGHQGYSKGERHLEECYIMDPISSTTVPNFSDAI